MSDNFWIKDSVKDVYYESIYETGKEIGRRPFQPVGSASFTFLCKDKGTKEQWVVKSLQKKIRLKEVFESAGFIQIISEHVNGGELFNLLQNLDEYSESFLSYYVRQIMTGVEYLHVNGIIHRNLKPRNLLLADTPNGSIVKIADTCFSTILGRDQELESTCGDPCFAAPEVLLTHKVGTSVDMWAIGVILYIMICGVEPFQRSTEDQTFRSILHASYDFDLPEWTTVSLHAKDAVKRLLVADPLIRMTAAQALKHAWITGDGAPSVNLPASRFSIGKYNRRHARRVERLQKEISFDVALHLDPVLRNRPCGSFKYEQKKTFELDESERLDNERYVSRLQL